MADEFDRVGLNLKLDRPVTIYQAEDGALINPAIVMGALAADVRESGPPATVKLEIADEFGNLVARTVERGRIRPGMSVELTAGKIALRPGERLRASCSPPGAVDLYVSLLRSGSMLGRVRVPSREVYARFLPPDGIGADPNIRMIDAPLSVSVTCPPPSVLTGGSAVLSSAKIQAYFLPPDIRLPGNVVFVRPALVKLRGEAPSVLTNGTTYIFCPTEYVAAQGVAPVIGNGGPRVPLGDAVVSAFAPQLNIDIPVQGISYSKSSGTAPLTATAATMANGSFAAGDDFVTNNTSNQFIQMDLGRIYVVNRVVVGTSTSFTNQTRNREIQCSLDGINWFTVTNTSGRSDDASSMPAAGIYVYRFASVNARYVRLFTASGAVGASEFYAVAPGQAYPRMAVPVNSARLAAKFPDLFIVSNAMTTIPVPSTEIEVVGLTPVNTGDPAPIPVNSITYSQSSVFSGTTAANNSIMTDKSFSNTGAATSQANPAWVRMDLGKNYIINRVIVGTATSSIPGGWNKSYTENRNIQYSLDGSSWTTAANTGTMPTNGIYTYNVSFTARYIRIATSNNDYVAVSEFYALAPGQTY